MDTPEFFKAYASGTTKISPQDIGKNEEFCGH